MLTRLARVLLAVALLAGWQAALVHPLEHSDEHGGFVHLADGHSGNAQSNGSVLCDALAALTASAPQAKFVFEPPASSRPNLFWFKAEQRLAQAPPFLSQGPPAVL